MALDEDGRPVGVEADREHHRGEVERRAAQLLRLVGGGDRVQVDDAEEGLAFLLDGNELAERSGEVAEVLRAGGLDAAEGPHRSRPQYRNYISCRMAVNGSPELLIVMGAGATADQ